MNEQTALELFKIAQDITLTEFRISKEVIPLVKLEILMLVNQNKDPNEPYNPKENSDISLYLMREYEKNAQRIFNLFTTLHQTPSEVKENP